MINADNNKSVDNNKGNITINNNNDNDGNNLCSGFDCIIHPEPSVLHKQRPHSPVIIP